MLDVDLYHQHEDQEHPIITVLSGIGYIAAAIFLQLIELGLYAVHGRMPVYLWVLEIVVIIAVAIGSFLIFISTEHHPHPNLPEAMLGGLIGLLVPVYLSLNLPHFDNGISKMTACGLLGFFIGLRIRGFDDALARKRFSKEFALWAFFAAVGILMLIVGFGDMEWAEYLLIVLAIAIVKRRARRSRRS